MAPLISFDEALTDASTSLKTGAKPSLLLGNGFSRAYQDSIFSYEALLKKAKFSKHGTFLKRVFAVLSTSDFEAVIRLFVQMRIVLEAISPKPNRLIKFFSDVEQVLKSALADTLAANHPDGPFEITDAEYSCVRSFLSPFGDIYTLNYDLLLYWALMHEEEGSVRPVDDGFRNPDDPDCDYVTWEPENRYNQSVHYLHGALHIFDSGDEIRKFTWCRTGVRLKEQILVELNNNRYPLIITEGLSSSKKAKIFHNIYLASSYKSVLAKTGCLFIYGASLGEHDEHILRALRENRKIKSVYFGIFGNPDSESARETMARISTLATAGKKIAFYDAKTAKVWR